MADIEKLEDLIGVKEAARYLGLAVKTTYVWAESGRLPAYRIGRALRFRKSELAAYIEASRLNPKLTRAKSALNLPSQRKGSEAEVR